MNATWFLVVGIAIGIAVGIAIGLLLRRAQATNNQKIIEQAREAFSNQAAASFKSLSMDVLTPVTNQLVTVASSKLAEQQTQAAQELEKKKALIDQTLVTMNTELSKVQSTMQELKEKGENQFGGLTQQLAAASLQTSKLTDITTRLKEALASGKTRGLWGERMADDILRAAGFKEGVNYLKQKEELSGNRPDFTFLLPRNLRLNMDVKFPLDNYMGVISATTDEERVSYTKKFLSDVQQRVKEINSRGYIDPGNGTVDCVLLFIPIESVFGFAQEQDPELLDSALSQHVILCSPSTLFAVLAIIRQATDTFAIQQNVGQILTKFAEFDKQWRQFTDKYEKLKNHIQNVEEDFKELSGVRTHKLDVVLEEIHALEEQHREEEGSVSEQPGDA
ncbi:DNA recombination protein RmuC [bacterium]|nr:DNA recombination protein RmuC [bacterium]